MRRSLILLWMITGLFAGCATCPCARRTPAGTAVHETVTASATVVRVDAKRRLITFQGADGRRITTRVHARVADLERLRPGDVVTATYYESIAYDVKKPGQAVPGVAEAEDVTGGAGAPGGSDARSITVTAPVGAVDRGAGTLTLHAPDAAPVTVRVKDPRALSAVKPGDLVEITYSEAVTVALDPKR
jgi:hypothetical protein